MKRFHDDEEDLNPKISEDLLLRSCWSIGSFLPFLLLSFAILIPQIDQLRDLNF